MVKCQQRPAGRAHIHEVGDGRGPHDVFLDGRLIKRVVYADIRRGLVRVADWPLRVHKHGKRVIIRTLRGVVEAVPHEETA